jgi:hypothetical protein
MKVCRVWWNPVFPFDMLSRIPAVEDEFVSKMRQPRRGSANSRSTISVGAETDAHQLHDSG